jgi:hypothetical protein
LPVQAGNAGKVLSTNGSTAFWQTIDTGIPPQTGNEGKFLTTNGVSPSWQPVPITSPGIATTWVAFRGRPTAQVGILYGDGGVTSVQRVATGIYQINFAPGLMQNVNYIFVGTASQDDHLVSIRNTDYETRSVGSIRITTHDPGSGNNIFQDTEFVMLVFFGGK